MSGQDADELRIRRLLRRRIDGTETGSDAELQPQPDAVTAAAAAAHSDPLWDRRPQPLPHPNGDWWDALYADETAAAAAQPDQEDEAQPGRREQWMRIPPWWSGRHVDTTPPDDENDNEPKDGKEEPDGEDDVDDQEDEEDLDDEDGEEAQPRSRSAQPRKPTPHSRNRGKRSRPRGPGVPQSPLERPPAPRQSLLDAYAAIPLRIRWLVLHSSAAATGYRMGWVDYATRTAAWIATNGFLTASAVFWYAVAVGCEVLRHRAQHTRLPVRWLAAVPIASIVTGTLLYGTDWTHLDLEFPL
ncbi:hypothetical protein [Streptomyces canus]|uniref:hypothetical protein n=1 Tax=Streptomyces canus TaxID=58343 RepID=UPI00386CE38B|nr:hypothetical protein OH824_17815 [Streptomyces canus]